MGELNSQFGEAPMVNIPYRSSESLMQERISTRLSEMRRTAGAIVLAFVAALLLAVLLSRLPEGFGGSALHDLLPLDDPSAMASFTA
jgi:hypothetical protein